MREHIFHRLYVGAIVIGIGSAFYLIEGPSPAAAILIGYGIILILTGFERKEK